MATFTCSLCLTNQGVSEGYIKALKERNLSLPDICSSCRMIELLEEIKDHLDDICVSLGGLKDGDRPIYSILESINKVVHGRNDWKAY